MTATGERGIVCQMQIDPENQSYLRRFSTEKTGSIQSALKPLLDELPKPVFRMHWNAEQRLWTSQIVRPNELPPEIREVFEKTGYGCLAAEADIGIVHVCHASDEDIEGFKEKSVLSRWQLIKMPTAPLIRLELDIIDRPDNPFSFESFLNVAEEDQSKILAQLANQDRFYLTFYGDRLDYRFTKIIPHSTQQWQQLDELISEAQKYWSQIPAERRNYDQAKAEFMGNSD